MQSMMPCNNDEAAEAGRPIKFLGLKELPNFDT